MPSKVEDVKYAYLKFRKMERAEGIQCLLSKEWKIGRTVGIGTNRRFNLLCLFLVLIDCAYFLEFIRLLNQEYFPIPESSSRSTRALPVAAMIHDNSTDRTALVPATHHSNFCPINFRW
ncbi:hypothetical protein L1887_41291 [Cichorium endivia]|nr:hypothetical protein L1887_41291 [Cichorium endivia]